MGVPRIIKISTIIFILSAGLIGSYLIIKNSVPTTENTENKEGSTSENNELSLKNPLQWVEENVLNKTDDKSISDSQDNQSGNNLTQSLGQSIFEQIKPLVKASQNGEGSTPDINLMSGNLTEDFLREHSGDLNLISDIDDSKLKISRDNSRKAKIRYLNITGDFNKRDFGNFNKNYLEIIIDVFRNSDTSSARQLANIYRNLADDYFNTEVPSDWVDFHKKMIIYFKNSETIYSAMAEYLNDPVKSYLALEMVEKISVDDAQEIENLINKKIQEVK